MSDSDTTTSAAGGGALVDVTIAESRQLLDTLRQRPGYAWSDAEVLANLRAVHALESVLAAVKLGFVAELAQRPEAVPGAHPATVAATFLTRALHVTRGQAARDVAAATLLASPDPQLPELAAALAEGAVSRTHVDTAVSTVRRMPAALKKAVTDEGVTGTQVMDAVLTEQARTSAPGTVHQLGRDLLQVLDPDRAEKLDADAVVRRTGSMVRDYLGMGVFRFTLDPATTALTVPVLHRWAEPRPPTQVQHENGDISEREDLRTYSQRLADAFAAIVAAVAHIGPQTQEPLDVPAQGSADVNTADDEPMDDEPMDDEPMDDERESAGPRDDAVADGKPGPAGHPHSTGAAFGVSTGTLGEVGARLSTDVEVLVITTLDQLAAAHGATDPAARAAGLARLSLAGDGGTWPGSTLDPATLARLTCDGPLRRVLLSPSGAVLDLGRRQRLASPGQKKALAARDLGCCIPGCDVPPEWCDVHHAIPWSQGGPTNAHTMVLVCQRDHTAIHAGIYDIQMRDGIPWVRLPAWMDYRRPWLRNLTHHHRHRARQQAQQLAEQRTLDRRGTMGDSDSWPEAG